MFTTDRFKSDVTSAKYPRLRAHAELVQGSAVANRPTSYFTRARASNLATRMSGSHGALICPHMRKVAHRSSRISSYSVDVSRLAHLRLLASMDRSGIMSFSTGQHCLKARRNIIKAELYQ